MIPKVPFNSDMQKQQSKCLGKVILFHRFQFTCATVPTLNRYSVCIVIKTLK